MITSLELPLTSNNDHFSNLLLAKIFANLIYHFRNREESARVFNGLLNMYIQNRMAIEKFDYDHYKVISFADTSENSKGFIVGTGHYGYFALVPLLLADFFKKNVSVVVLDNAKYYNQAMDKYRHLFKKDYIVKPLELKEKKNLFSVAKSIINGEIILIYADANYSTKEVSNFIDCNFLGHKIKARPGIGILSYLTKSPIVFATLDTCSNSNLLHVTKFINVTQDDKKENFKTLMQSFYSELEKFIQKRPDNWFLWNLFHDLITKENITPNINNISYDYALSLDINKLFYFNYKNEHFLHLVDLGKNIKITSFHMDIIHKLLEGPATIRQIQESCFDPTQYDKITRFLIYLKTYNALEVA